MEVFRYTAIPGKVEHTINVVRADVMKRWPLGPGWGSSSSVMKNMRLVAVFGALHSVSTQFDSH